MHLDHFGARRRFLIPATGASGRCGLRQLCRSASRRNSLSIFLPILIVVARACASVGARPFTPAERTSAPVPARHISFKRPPRRCRRVAGDLFRDFRRAGAGASGIKAVARCRAYLAVGSCSGEAPSRDLRIRGGVPHRQSVRRLRLRRRRTTSVRVLRNRSSPAKVWLAPAAAGPSRPLSSRPSSVPPSSARPSSPEPSSPLLSWRRNAPSFSSDRRFSLAALLGRRLLHGGRLLRDFLRSAPSSPAPPSSLRPSPERAFFGGLRGRFRGRLKQPTCFFNSPSGDGLDLVCLLDMTTTRATDHSA